MNRKRKRGLLRRNLRKKRHEHGERQSIGNEIAPGIFHSGDPTGEGESNDTFAFPTLGGLLASGAVPNNPVYSFFATRGSLAPVFLRLALAVVFFFHGVQQTFGWFGGRGWTNTIALWTSAENYGLPFVLAALILVAQLAVPLALLFGFLTRLAAFAVVLMIAGWLIFVQEVTRFESAEFSIVVIAAALSLVITGGGSFSLDRAISVNLLPQVG
jgi:putative oxidoreductase